MKYCMIITALLLSLAGPLPAETPLEGTLSFSGAWALYPMAVRWAEEFQKLHPGVRFDISAGGAGKGMTDCLAGAIDVGMVSRDIAPAEAENGAFGISVAKDAVVPVINAGNPLLKTLLTKGITQDGAKSIWITGTAKSWRDVTGQELKAPLRVYTRSDACGAAETWAKYLGGRQEDLKGIGVYGDPGTGEAVRKDPLGVGYNNVNYAYDAKTQRPVAGLVVLPLDVDGSGSIEPNEDFYKTRKELTDAIADGRYPSPPARNLFFVTKGRPGNPLLTAFIEWVLTDGQQFVQEAGYINLSQEVLQNQIKKLKEVE
ncbi:MAG TPA: extracellular solute-binding protein [Kiritimatiellia bacterium]|nr:extracellular solute-binding protein [Kiritimatiellia bacterium]HNR95216.1 extracellular solute-binding protein [Kiritimatiellia bacterium]HNS80759.1 extracellular solute-binding protein [Kiritimatiellia bacterium]HPA77520.1 extracellular solute-binding protein [Kiritimatiellia bacterium]